MNIEDWINSKLSKFLSFPAPPDWIDYICKIDQEKDFQEYFTSLLNYNDPEQVAFVNELAQKLLHGNSSNSFASARPEPKTPNFSLNLKQENGPPARSEPLRETRRETFPTLSGSKQPVQETKKISPPKEQSEGKKKPKYVNLYSSEGRSKDVIILPGRHKCTCEASKHALVNNCLNCGRIVCAQEGPGPCFFCDRLVCTKEQARIVGRGSKKSEKLIQHLLKQTGDAKMDQAVDKKNKLLEYDKQSHQMTRVIDDQRDFYSLNNWQSEKERNYIKTKEDDMLQQRYGSRRDKKFTLDFSGRRVFEDEVQETFNPEDDPVLKQLQKDATKINPKVQHAIDSNPNVTTHKPKFIDTAPTKGISDSPVVRSELLDGRVQDKELLEMSDQGKCMSMHQPWASLLVRGIKKHEGRTWYTKHRGPLWIAAAAKVPTQEEIDCIEQMHSQVAQKENLDFPKNYPTGCLLGKVNIADCLPQDQYREMNPDGLSESPYVFICENTQELPFFLPIKGAHKLFALDRHLHQAAVMSLKRKGLMQNQQRLESSH